MSDPMRESGEERQAREAEIAERLKGISPAPWQTDPRFHGKVYCDDSLGSMVADCSSAYTLAVSHLTEEANAAFIANAPSDLSYLLAEVSILRERVATLGQDAKRLDWLEQNSATVAVFDPPSGDAWVWSVAATDDAGNVISGMDGDGATLRQAIDAAKSRVSSPPSEVTPLEGQ